MMSDLTVKPKLRKAEVEWIDSVSSGRWGTREEYIEKAAVPLCWSVGYVLVNDKERIVLLQSCSDNGDVADSISIPKKAVRRLRYVHGGVK